MFILKEALKKNPLSAQLKHNASGLPELKRLLKGKTFADVRSDYNILSRLDELMGSSMPPPQPPPQPPQTDPAAHLEAAKRELNFALETKKVAPFKTFCEIGCGFGSFPRAAFEMGCDFSCGLDIMPFKSWESLLADTNGRLEYSATDISVSTHERKYEMVTSFSAFEHFKNPPLMLKAMSGLVEEGGFLYINFSPIYNAANGLHMARYIQVPWHHLIFSGRVLDQYYHDRGLSDGLRWNKEWLNKWSSMDFMNMFANFTEMRLLSIQPFWDLSYYWFARIFSNIMPPQVGLEELMINGFRVVYKK